MLIQNEHKKAALHVKKSKLAFINMEAHRPAVKKMKPVSKTAAPCNYLMPPRDNFNTGYLKPREHDPL